MKDKIGFKCYEHEGKHLILGGRMDQMEDMRRYDIDADSFFLSEPAPDPRSRFQKFIDRWKWRLGHAWYALRGGKCD